MIRLKLIKVCGLLTAFFCVATPSISNALPDDRNQPIHITSDTAEVDDKTGLSIYRGKVKIIQGTINLVADQVTIHSDNQGISKLVAIGAPAHFQQLPEIEKTITHAFGNTIEYFVSEERIELKKQAKLEQEQNVFTGERIDYDIKRRVVNAYGDQQPNSSATPPRVNLIIQPNKTNNSATKDNPANE
ncbi:MAG: lipopolysaccharide transport periplasmic protein LptA [Pseudomonadales bacterium]